MVIRDPYAHFETYFQTYGNFELDPHTQKWNVDNNVTLKVQTTQIPVPFDRVDGDFRCDSNQLTSLINSPSTVTEGFIAMNNPLESLEGSPHYVGGTFMISYDPRLPLLQVLKYNWVHVDGVPAVVREILHKYRGQGKSGAIACAAELIKAGYKENARW